MKYARWLCLLFLMSVSAVSIAGDIQVLCEPGLRVYLDDELVGTSSVREDGFSLMDVPTGGHTIRVEKNGFVPQNIKVTVMSIPIEVEVGELSPVPPGIPEAGPSTVSPEASASTVEHLVGNLVVLSAPQNCVVEIDGRTEMKSFPQLFVDDLAAGEHTISFSKQGYDPISGVVTIHPGAEVRVRGNLKAGTVETIYEGTGSFRLFSKPKKCKVRFVGKYIEKIHNRLNLTQLPAGEYPIVVSISGRQMSNKVFILDGKRTIVEVSFMRGDEPFVVSFVPE